MKTMPLIIVLLLSVLASNAQNINDSLRLKACALDYVEGWYTGDTIRMDRALHPDLVKRQITSLDKTKGPLISEVSKSSMMEYTRAGFGKAVPRDKIRNEVMILDIYQDMADVKVVSSNFVDYLHLVKWNGEWKILNVLWKTRPGA